MSDAARRRRKPTRSHRELAPIFNETCDHRQPICACGRFVSDVVATVGAESIREVHGTCKAHGRVTAYINLGWSWEDFYGTA